MGFLEEIEKKNNSTAKQKIEGLASKEYEHPLDRKAIQALKGTPGLEKLAQKFFEYNLEKYFKVIHTGSNIKTTSDSFPELYDILEEICNVIDLKKTPDLYIKHDPYINASTTGVKETIIVVTTGCLEKLSLDEIYFILGHEAGHIKSKHVLYSQMAKTLPILGDLIGNITLGFGKLFSSGLNLALLNWERKSEFTADRVGLLSCQNIDASITAMMKLAGAPPSYHDNLNPNDFIKQAKEFDGLDECNIEKIIKLMNISQMSHPWTVLRAAEMNKWIENGSYNNILDRSEIDNRSACLDCGEEFSNNESFCSKCGNKL